MASYLSSNQPYQRVDDGIMNGAVTGAVVAGAATGAAQMWGQRGINALQDSTRNRLQASQDQMTGTMNREGVTSQESIGAQRRHYKNVNRGLHGMRALSAMEGAHGAVFGGGWKGKAIAYGGSVLAGGLLGAGVDAMN